MNPQAFLKDLESLVNLKPGETIVLDTRFREAPWWDSMVALNLLVLFEEHAGKQLSPQSLAQCETLQDVCAMAG
ncbi:MAG: acyl carrier protein [Opitutales bacterium]|nr:acyl carrier protein [Opitutales bacterium]